MLQYPLIAPDHGADARLAKGDVFSGGVSVMCHINVELIVPRERKLIVAFDRNGKYWRGGSAVTSAFQNTVCGWRTVALTLIQGVAWFWPLVASPVLRSAQSRP